MKELKWTKFSDERPDCSWVWISDFKTVRLEFWPDCCGNGKDEVWAKAEIQYPAVPKKPYHVCSVKSDFGSFHCYQDPSDGFLYLNHDASLIQIQNCPFCGFKPEEK